MKPILLVKEVRRCFIGKSASEDMAFNSKANRPASFHGADYAFSHGKWNYNVKYELQYEMESNIKQNYNVNQNQTESWQSEMESDIKMKL